MKCFFSKSFLISTLTLSFLSSTTYGGKYEDIFTIDIYEQESILTKLPSDIHLSEESINKELEKHLVKLKEQQLNKSCLQRIKKKVEILSQDYVQAVERAYWESVLHSVSKALSLPIGVGLATASGYEGVGAIGGLITLPLLLLGEQKINRVFPTQSAAIINGKIRDLNLEIMDLTDGLTTEPIKRLELEYIKKKRLIPNQDLKKEIEKALIEARKSDYFSGIATQLVGLTLNLPLRSKPLFNSQQPMESRRKILKEFNENKFFSHFNKETKDQIESIIVQTATDSVATGNEVSTRKGYYFYGDPSGGKTCAAKEIARFLAVPYFELSVRSATELNQENLEGWERLRPGASIGWLAKPFLETVEGERETYSNAFLILNDLDRLLNGVDAKQATTTLAFLLDYLDPEKKKFYSPYFRTNIDIKHLNIIITANQQLDDNFFFNALKTRVSKFVNFPRFQEEKIREIMGGYLKALIIHHHVPEWFVLGYLNPLEIQVEYKQGLAGSYEIPNELLDGFKIQTEVAQEKKDTITLRELKHKLDESVNNFMIQNIKEVDLLFENGKNQLNKNDDQGRKSIIKAALKGHEQACYWLGQNMPASSIAWHEEGVRRGVKECASALGLYYAKLNELIKAKKWYEEALFLGDDSVEDWICDYYETKEKNNNEARDGLFSLLKHRPLSVKIAKSLNTVGDRFSSESPIKAEKAYECYNVAIKYGYNDAIKSIYNLGDKIERQEGLGNIKAKKYYGEAAMQSNSMAQFKLGYLEWLDQNYGQAIKYLKDSIKNDNNKFAQHFLGICYLYGWTSEYSCNWSCNCQVYDYWSQAALQGEYLAKIERHVHVPSKPETELKLISDRQEDAKLILIYLKPFIDLLENSVEELETAEFLRSSFHKSKIKDDFFGIDMEYCNTIGLMYLHGIGLPRNSGKRDLWFRRANKLGNKRKMVPCTLF